MADHETARAGVTIIDPLGGSIVEALDNRTHRLERWNLSDQDWMRWGAGPRQREELVGPGRFLKQHGYRLVPVEPETERVKLHQCIGRRLACEPSFVIADVRVSGPYPVVSGWRPGTPITEQSAWNRRQQSLVLGHDGEVEVLVEGPAAPAPRTDYGATVAYVEEQRAAGHGISFEPDSARDQREVLRRARQLSNAKRSGNERAIRHYRAELERAAARLR